MTAEAILDGNASMWNKNEGIAYMAIIEDDERIVKFLSRYALERDLTKNALLNERYLFLGEWEKRESLRQLFLHRHVDEMIGNRSLWVNGGREETPDRLLAVNQLQLNLLHSLYVQTPDAAHPISANGEVDFWVHERLWLGLRRACCLAPLGDVEGAFLILEDIVSLLEKAMKITSLKLKALKRL